MLCPDCEREIPDAEFVTHRENEHPPAPIEVSGAGDLKSLTAFGTDPEE